MSWLPDWLRGWLEEPIVAAWLATLAWAAGVALLLQVAGALAGGSVGRGGNAGALALVLGLAAGVMTVVPGVPALPPAERWQWCLWLAVGALLLLLFEERQRAAAMLRFLVQLGLVVALLLFVVRPSGRARDWTPLELQIAQIGGGLLLLLLLLLGEARVAIGAGWRTSLPALLTTAGSVAVIGDCSSDRLARCAAALFAAQAVELLVSLVQRAALPSRTAWSAATIAWGALLAYVWCARSISDGAAAALLLAWACALLGDKVGVKSAAPGRTLLTAVVLPAGLVVAAWFLRMPPR